MNKLSHLYLILLTLIFAGCGWVIVESTSHGPGGGVGGKADTSSSNSSSDNLSGGQADQDSSSGQGGFGGDSGGGGNGGSQNSAVTGSGGQPSTTVTATLEDPLDCELGTTYCPGVCCDAPQNPNMCVGNLNGYCCTIEQFCLPKGQ